MNLVLPKKNDARMELLISESDNVVAPETPGGITLSGFESLLLKNETELGIRVIRTGRRRIRGLQQSLGEALERRQGIALISSGEGHCVGLSCRDCVAVDSDLKTPYPVDLRCDQGLSMLANLLDVEEDVRVCVLYIDFAGGF
jgi:hypothetical protein